MKTDIETLRNADWDRLERDVLVRIRALKAICSSLDATALNDKIAAELVLPALRILGQFCTTVKIEE